MSQNLRSEEKTLHQVRNIVCGLHEAGRHGRRKICYSEKYWSVTCSAEEVCILSYVLPLAQDRKTVFYN